jgi:hypothetical protein
MIPAPTFEPEVSNDKIRGLAAASLPRKRPAGGIEPTGRLHMLISAAGGRIFPAAATWVALCKD